ncbi:hypothetical protein VPH35_073012 [Triticum aestivum]
MMAISRWCFFNCAFILFSHGHHPIFVCLMVHGQLHHRPSFAVVPRPPTAPYTPSLYLMACSSMMFDRAEDFSRGMCDNNENVGGGCIAQGSWPRCSSMPCRVRVVEVHLMHCCMFTCGHALIFILSVCSSAVEGVHLIPGVVAVRRVRRCGPAGEVHEDSDDG